MNESLKNTNFDDVSYALSNITNLIAQEIYKLAVMKLYPLELASIRKLDEFVKKELIPAKDNYTRDSFYEELVEKLVTEIVLDTSHEKVFEDVNYLIDSQYNDNLADDEGYIVYFNQLKQDCIELTVNTLNKHPKLQCRIPHKYPPSVLCFNNDLLDALFYYHGLVYKTKIKKIKDGFDHYHIPEPYEVRKPYVVKSTYKSKHMTKEITIPNTALKNCLGPSIMLEGRTNELEALVHLDMLISHEKEYFSHELRICVDTSEPMSDSEVNKILAYVKFDLYSAQRKNKIIKFLQAENIADLIKAYEIPDITTDGIVKMHEMHKASIPGLNNAISAKNYLCGLIILKRYFFECRTEKKTLETLCEELSKELKELDNEKFSSETISKAYKKVKKFFDSQVNELRSEEEGT